MGTSTADWVRAALERNVDRSAGEGACWPWLKGVDGDGFAVIYVPDPEEGWRYMRAHRLAFAMATLPPGDMDPCDMDSHVSVVQLCGNRRCCNPSHSQVRGAPVRRAGRRLGATEHEQIRAARAEGATLAEVAQRFGISTTHASRLGRRS